MVTSKRASRPYDSEATKAPISAAALQLLADTGFTALGINALLLAGLQHLALREHSVGSFAGLDLKDPNSRQRIRNAVRSLTAGVYVKPPSTGQATPSTSPHPS